MPDIVPRPTTRPRTTQKPAVQSANATPPLSRFDSSRSCSPPSDPSPSAHSIGSPPHPAARTYAVAFLLPKSIFLHLFRNRGALLERKYAFVSSMLSFETNCIRFAQRGVKWERDCPSTSKKVQKTAAARQNISPAALRSNVANRKQMQMKLKAGGGHG